VTTISGCLITLEEESVLQKCLEALSFCDEIVVVDSGSRDRTREMAREAGAIVIENPWPGFAAQRNVALDAAGGDWILEVDADEWISPQLGAEIREFVERAAPDIHMTAIPLRQIFLGRALGPSARYPGYRHRLFRAGAFRHDATRTVHEGLWPDGPTPPLEHDLFHQFAASWREALRDAAAYARLEAAQRGRPDVATLLVGTMIRPAARFGYRCFVYGGWRDGWPGMAKIGLECGADALATVLGLRLGTPDGRAGFGQEQLRRGPARIVGVCLRRKHLPVVLEWLATAAGLGADVAVIAPGSSAGYALPWRRLERPGPGALARALDAEDQARPIDALLLPGRLERLLVGFSPRALRGAVAPIDPSIAPDKAVASVHDGRRGRPSS
jgi:Glycosyl transferase family 2